ncbi:MAG: hypothetical protein RIS64_2395 [Bacteroidota bacterium]|jgi:hypothetical protein
MTHPFDLAEQQIRDKKNKLISMSENLQLNI